MVKERGFMDFGASQNQNCECFPPHLSFHLLLGKTSEISINFDKMIV
jgi:hypothetical protein